MSPLLFYIFAVIYIQSAWWRPSHAIDIVNHVALSGSGIKDAGSPRNTLFIKISSPSKDLTAEFVQGLTAAIVEDHCDPSFSGRVARSLTYTIYCGWLGNKERMSIQEKKPLPALQHMMAYLGSQQCVLDDYEYLGEYRRPSQWSGTYETIDKDMRLYFDRLDGKCGLECQAHQELCRRNGGNGAFCATLAQDQKNRVRPRDEVRGKFVENMAPWGLDRIDHHFGLLDNDYNYNNLGDQVDIYIIDTGVRLTHNEFEGRAHFLVNTVGDNVSGDCVGHGTHVSSLAAGHTYGAAKGAQIWDAKSLGCAGEGNTFTIVSATMAIIEHAATRALLGRRAVASLSLGGDFSIAINNAMLSMVQANIVVVVAAGNEYGDACDFSPSSMGTNAGVLTVGASNIADSRPAWSNYGSCVSISAPGVEIIGAWPSSNAATNTLSGSSMATPFVSGVAALTLNQNLSLTVPQVKQSIVTYATPSVVTGASSTGGGKNLLYSLVVPGTVPPLLTAPPTLSPPVPIPSSSGSSSVRPLSFMLLSSLVLLYIALGITC